MRLQGEARKKKKNQGEPAQSEIFVCEGSKKNQLTDLLQVIWYSLRVLQTFCLICPLGTYRRK